jgi:hypothetical protein
MFLVFFYFYGFMLLVFLDTIHLRASCAADIKSEHRRY